MQGLAFRVADIRGPQSAGICRNICGPGKSLRYGSKNRSVGGLYKPGDAWRRPYKDTPPTRAVRRAGGIPWARFHSACAALDPELGLTEV